MNVTEREILVLLREAFVRAAEHCDKLAVVPSRGPHYKRLCEDLKTAENCCRQVAWYREDTRWLQIGLMMEEAHRRAGTWLRDKRMPRTANSNLAHPLFVRLAENLRYGVARVQELETRATGRVGMILPKVRRADVRTNGRVVQVRTTPGGIIIPEGVAA